MFFKKTKFNEKLLKCPRCRIMMDKIKQNNVILDVCRSCNGMWLDDKEIEKLINKAKLTNKLEKPKGGNKKDGKK